MLRYNRNRARGRFFPLFSPRELFYGSVPGAWYDPTDVNVNWRRNLLTYTEQFNNAAWTKVNATVTADATTAPDGTLTADKFVEGVAGTKSISSSTTHTLVAGQMTLTVYAKADTRRYLGIGSAGGSGYWTFIVVVDTLLGVVTTNTYSTPVAITDAGNGWYRIAITPTITTGGTGSWAGFSFVMYQNGTSTGWNYTGDGVSGLFLWGAQLEVGSSASVYQQIVTPQATYGLTQVANLWQGAAASSIPVYDVEQPIGLILDKSKGVAQNALPITGWAKVSGDGTVTVVDGLVTITGATTTTRVEISPSGWSTNQIGYMTVTASTSSSTGASVSIGGVGAVGAFNGTYKYVQLVNNGTQCRLEITSGSATFDVTARGTYAGNHAYQTTAASRPVLRARYNRLTYSEQLDNAIWTKTTTTVAANSIASPDGTTTADTLTASGANATTLQSVTLSLGASYTFSVWLQRKTGTGNIDISADGVTYTTQTITSSWARYTVTQTLTSGAKTPGIRIATNGDAVYAWGAQLMSANDVTATGNAYQRIAAATVYDTAPIFRPYVEFDGVDDSWLTGSINFTTTDKMSLFAGATRLQDATTSFLTEFSADWSANNGSFFVTAPDPGNLWAVGSRGAAAASGTQIAATSSATYAAPNTAVLTGTYDISGDLNVLRLNGAQVVTAVGDQGAGNFGNYPLYIGRRNNASFPYKGRLYELLLRGAASSTTEIIDMEQWTNARTGAF